MTENAVVLRGRTEALAAGGRVRRNLGPGHFRAAARRCRGLRRPGAVRDRSRPAPVRAGRGRGAAAGGAGAPARGAGRAARRPRAPGRGRGRTQCRSLSTAMPPAGSAKAASVPKPAPPVAAASVSSAEAAVESAAAGVEAAQAAIQSALSGIRAAEAAVTRAEDELTRLVVHAPFAGILETDGAELGSLLHRAPALAPPSCNRPDQAGGLSCRGQVRPAWSVWRAGGARLSSGRECCGRGHLHQPLGRSADPQPSGSRSPVPNPDQRIRDGQTANILIQTDGSPAICLRPRASDAEL